MRLTRMHCDGCGRTPHFGEWIRGELSADGYQDWRHPGIAFRSAGCPISYENRAKSERLFESLFGRPLPDEMGFLCPECQSRVEAELPELAAADQGENLRSAPRHLM
jgi:hypothetical protein